MAEYVKSNVVSMNWVRKGFVKLNNVFYFACQEYKNNEGKRVNVMFTTTDAFLFADGDDVSDLWSINDIVPWAVKSDAMSAGFPYVYDEYITLCGEGGLREDLLAKYGILEYKGDIEARMADVAKFDALE